MKNKNIIIGSIIFLLIVLLIGVVIIISDYQPSTVENINEIESITLSDNLTAEIYSDKNISDFIVNINGTLVDDQKIDTSKLGDLDISFTYLNSRKRKIKTSFTVSVVDTTPPLINLGSSYTVVKGYKNNLEDVILCGDNYDSNPTCTITGEYDLNKIGEYDLNYTGIDNSGNESSVDFTLKVVEKYSYNDNKTDFSNIVSLHKSDNTSIGIDVSKWQGSINWNKIKDNGVEFVMIRVGYQNGIEGESIIDPYFKINIEGAIEAGIKTGVYYYSYAKTTDEAKEQVNWITEKLQEYNIELPISFDWECWTSFNTMDLSFFELNQVANAFLTEVKKKGYTPMLYSSKNYLEKIWNNSEYLTWLAHYTDKTSYTGNYLMWQLCDNGIIPGINGYVDIDVMYHNKNETGSDMNE